LRLVLTQAIGTAQCGTGPAAPMAITYAQCALAHPAVHRLVRLLQLPIGTVRAAKGTDSHSKGTDNHSKDTDNHSKDTDNHSTGTDNHSKGY
jgi:hypothetical protein